MAAMQQAKGEADQERQAFEAHLRRRVAVLRWCYAGTAVLMPDFRARGPSQQPQRWVVLLSQIPGSACRPRWAWLV